MPVLFGVSSRGGHEKSRPHGFSARLPSETPRPRDRKPVGPGAEFADRPSLLESGGVIVGVVAGVAVSILRAYGQRCPRSSAATIFIDGASDLIVRLGGAPQKSFRVNSGACRSGRGFFRGVNQLIRDFPKRGKPASFAKRGARIFRTSSSPVSVFVTDGDPVDFRTRQLLGAAPSMKSSTPRNSFEPIARVTIRYMGS